MNEWQKMDARRRQDRRERDIAVAFFIAGLLMGFAITWIF